MSISDELAKLDALRRSGSLTHDEFEVAKRKVLGETDTRVGDASLEEIKRQNELAQLDREWSIEREKYMITGRYGNRHVPTKASTAIGGVFVVVFGVFWTAMATSMTGIGSSGIFSLFPLFGVIFILFGAGISMWGFVKAGQYEQAESRYQQRRADLIAQHKKQ